MRLSAHGLAVELPTGWEGRIYRRPAPEGGTTHPILHAATIPLPAERGDFGSGAVELLGPSDAFLAVVEYPPSSSGQAIFGTHDLPRVLDPDSFHPMALQRTIPGQGGLQVFCRHRGRAFSVYAVLGSHFQRHLVAPRLGTVLATLEVVPA